MQEQRLVLWLVHQFLQGVGEYWIIKVCYYSQVLEYPHIQALTLNIRLFLHPFLRIFTYCFG